MSELPTKADRSISSRPPKHPLEHSSPAAISTHCKTAPNLGSGGDEQDSDGASLLSDSDPYNDFAARDAKIAELRSLKATMDAAKTAYRSATKAYNDEVNKPEKDALASVSVLLSASENEALSTAEEERSLAISLLEWDRLLSSDSVNNACEMFGCEDMKIRNPDLHWLYINMMIDAKDRLRVA